MDLVCDGKWKQFEVLQAKNGSSVWNDFMQKRNGMYHVAFEAKDMDSSLHQIEAFSGHKAIQKGTTFMDPDYWYAYLDTRYEMGMTIELRTSDRIKERQKRIREERLQKHHTYGADLSVNQTTGIGNIMDDEELCSILSDALLPSKSCWNHRRQIKPYGACRWDWCSDQCRTSMKKTYSVLLQS